MTQPTYPLIMVYNNKVLNVIPTEAHLSKPTPFEFIRPAGPEVAFDRNGNKWTYHLTSTQFKDSFMRRLLAYTLLYNPVIKVKPEWTKQDMYQLQELKQVINQCVDKDDVITQFADADTVKTAIIRANSFDDLYKTLNKYIFEVNEAELWKEQENK